MSQLKYVRTAAGFLVFPALVATHKQVASACGWPVLSAGFVEWDFDGRPFCAGCSDSLGIQSRADDTEALRAEWGMTAPPTLSVWLPFDVTAPPSDGLYWVRSESPEVDVDVDDYGTPQGRYTGETESNVALVVFHGVDDGRPDFEVLDRWNSGDLPSDGWVTHYKAIAKPIYAAAPLTPSPTAHAAAAAFADGLPELAQETQA